MPLVYIYIYINNEIARPGLWILQVRAQLGAQPTLPGRPGWLDLASPGSIWLPLASLVGRPGPDWPDLATPDIWLARTGAPGRSGWLDLAALVAPGRPGWPSTAKKRLAFRLSASMLPASCALERLLMPQI